jgi:hypothetical protein
VFVRKKYIMVNLQDGRQYIVGGGTVVTGKLTSWWSVFRQFIFKGSVVDVAIGVIVGQAFQGLISSLTKDILMVKQFVVVFVFFV